MKKTLILLLPLLVGIGVTSLWGQVSTDSIARLTAIIGTGSLVERAEATWELQKVPIEALPSVTQATVIGEFERLNTLMRANQRVPGIEGLQGESFGEYYASLSEIVYAIDSPAAVRALASSAGGGVGLLQKAAEAGDDIIPLLAERIRDRFEAGDALETMGYAWFWADSTGIALSGRSRTTIMQHLVAATAEVPLQSAAALALENTRDPAFLDLARFLLTQNETESAGYFLERFTIPALEAVAAARSDNQLAESASRALAAICSGVASGRKHGACQSLASELSSALRHLRDGRPQPGHNVLESYLKNAAGALRSGAISEQEHLVMTGAVRGLLARHR